MAKSTRFRAIRTRLWNKRPICFVCKKTIKKLNSCSIEHIIPKSLGGTSRVRNFSISHKHCNFSRGAILCPVIWQLKMGITFPKNILNKPNVQNKPIEDEYKMRVRAWRLKLRQDYLDWVETNTEDNKNI